MTAATRAKKTRLVLASQSPARLALLRGAGFAPEAIVSGVDEDAFEAGSPFELTLVLAREKARAVAARVGPGALVIGCDSVLDLDGVALGKPADAEEAVARWKAMRGREGVLVTGHCLIDTRERPDAPGADWIELSEAEPTLVRFAEISDAEIDAYVRTGEPLRVAGAFTLDGLGGAFVDSIVGDPSNVIGLSLPLLRRLLAQREVLIPDLWEVRPNE